MRDKIVWWLVTNIFKFATPTYRTRAHEVAAKGLAAYRWDRGEIVHVDSWDENGYTLVTVVAEKEDA